MFFSPRKWITISPLNLLWLTDPHDLQGIPTPDWQTGLIPLGRICFRVSGGFSPS
jgi:hypothetical protein